MFWVFGDPAIFFPLKYQSRYSARVRISTNMICQFLEVVPWYFNIIITNKYPGGSSCPNAGIALQAYRFFRAQISYVQPRGRGKICGLQRMLAGVHDDNLVQGEGRLIETADQGEQSRFPVAGGYDNTDVQRCRQVYPIICGDWEKKLPAKFFFREKQPGGSFPRSH